MLNLKLIIGIFDGNKWSIVDCTPHSNKHAMMYFIVCSHGRVQILLLRLWCIATILRVALHAFLQYFVGPLMFALLFVFTFGIAGFANVRILVICVMGAFGGMQFQCDVKMLVCITIAAKGIVRYIGDYGYSD